MATKKDKVKPKSAPKVANLSVLSLLPRGDVGYVRVNGKKVKKGKK